MVLPLVGMYALRGLNGGTFNTSQSPLVEDDLFENVYDEEEDVLVYSGEDHEAVVNQNGLVQTEDEEFFLSNEEYRELAEIASVKLGAYEEIIGLETEEGETDRHIYIGPEEKYSGQIDEYTETEFGFDQVEDVLKADRGPNVEYESDFQRPTA